MTHAWIETSEYLPHEGDAVQFVVDRSGVLLQGVYERCVFKASWSYYAVVDVCRWRPLDRSAEHWSPGLRGPLTPHDATSEESASQDQGDQPPRRHPGDPPSQGDVESYATSAVEIADLDSQPLPRPGLRSGSF